MGVGVGARGDELQDKKKENLEASILVHRWYRNVIQRIHAYRWQQGGREDRLEGRQEGREDRQEGEDPHQEKELYSRKDKDSLKRYCGGSML